MSTAELIPEVDQKKWDEAWAILSDLEQRLSPEDADRLGDAIDLLMQYQTEQTTWVIKRFTAGVTEIVEQAFREIERERNSASRSSGQPSGWWPPWRR